MKALVTTLLISSAAYARAPTVNPVKPPSVQVPTVLPPKNPTVSADGSASGVTPQPTAPVASNKPRSPLVTTAYSEPAFQKVMSSGNVAVLFFSGVNDVIWAKQAPLLQAILRESEFRGLQTFQIDLVDETVIHRFAVENAATILVMKDGAERIRSTKMINADVIRKMLRLHSAL